MPCSVAQPIVVETGVGYTCGSTSTSRTKIFYPTGGYDKYPVVLFHPGSNGYPGQGYDKWLESVAKQCMIVIAPDTPSGYQNEARCKMDDDLLTAVKWAMSHPSSLPAKGDFGRIGAMGHSAGAHHLPLFVQNAKNEGININAAVLSHGGDDIYSYDLPGIPSFFLTSSGDTRERTNPEQSYAWFNKCNAYHKVFANLAQGGHGEPHEDYQFAAWTGRFLACHLFPANVNHPRRQETCPRIYGTNNDICREGTLATDYSTWKVPGCVSLGDVPTQEWMDVKTLSIDQSENNNEII